MELPSCQWLNIGVYNQKTVRPLEDKMENKISFRIRNSIWTLQKYQKKPTKNKKQNSECITVNRNSLSYKFLFPKPLPSC